MTEQVSIALLADTTGGEKLINVMKLATAEADNLSKANERLAKAGQDSANSYSRWWKEAIGEQERVSRISQSRDIESWKSSVREYELAEKSKTSAMKSAQMDRDRISAIEQRRDVELWKTQEAAYREMERANTLAAAKEAAERDRISAIEQKRDIESYKMRAQEAANAQKASFAATPQGVFQAAGIRSPADVARELEGLRQSRAMWEEAGKGAEGYHGQMAKINAQMSTLVEGNARHRGALRQTAAAMASLAFEAGGAAFLVTAVAGALAAPILPGVGLSKAIEDTRLGMASILISMGRINGVAPTLPQALQISSGMMDKLVTDSMRFGVSIEALANTLRATLAPGLAAGMNLEQIQKVATIGTIAVKTIGLDSRQTVQEIRDLVAGGIQSASSTLATSLGIKDSDIKRWREAGTLYDELMNKMQGFQIAAGENANTLSGSWDILQTKVALLMSSETGFNAIKEVIKSVSAYIGTFNEQTGKMEFNPDLLAQAKGFWDVLIGVKDVLAEIGKLLSLGSPVLVTALQTVAVVLSEITFTLTTVAKAMAVTATQVVAIAHLDFSGVTAIGKQWKEDAQAARIEHDKSLASILGIADKQSSAGKIIRAGAGSEEITTVPKATDAWAKTYENQVQKKADAIAKLDTLYADETRRFAGSQEHQIQLAKDYVEKLAVIEDQFGGKKARKAAADEEKKALTEQAKLYMEEAAARQKYAEGVGRETKSIEDKTAAALLETESIGKTKAEIDLLQAARYDHETQILKETLATYESANSCTVESEALKQAIAAREKYKQVQTDQSVVRARQAAIDEESKANKEMWNKVDGFAHEAFMNITTKGKNAFAEIGAALKKSVLDMLYQMTIHKWVFQISGVAGGVGAAGAAQAFGGATGGGTGDWLSAGKSIFDGFSGAFSYSPTATTGLSGMFNSFATSSMGQSLGMSTAGELSLATGEFAQSVSSFGSSIGTLGSYVGAGMAGIELGTMLAGDKSFAGMSGQTSAMVGTAIGTAIAGPIGAVIGGTLGGAVNAAFGRGPKVSGTTTLAGEFSGEGFAGQFQTPWSQKGGWFSSGRSGIDVQGIGAEQQAALNNTIVGTKSVFDSLIVASGDANKSIQDWTFSINRQVATQEQQNQLVLDIADSMGNYMIPSLEAFKQKGENLADTAVRMRDEFILTDTVLRLVGGSFGAVGLASMGARDNLVQLMGGVQGMNTTMQSYYQNFFTDAERHANDLGALTLQFAQLGLALPQSAADFKLLVSSQDLSTESGRQLFAALMSIQGAFAALIPSAESAAQAVNANIKALQDKSIADFEAARSATDSLRAFAVSVRELQRSLWIGQQTPLSSTYDMTRSQFVATNIAAGTGNVGAQGNLAGSATAFLDAAKMQATSAVEYARDFAFVQTSLDTTATLTENAVTVADQQLEEMKKSNAWLAALDTKSVSQTQSLQYLLSAAVASSEASRLAVVEKSISGLTDEIAKAVGAGYNQSNLSRSIGASGETALSYAGAYKTVSGSVSAAGVAGSLSTSISTAQQANVAAKEAATAAAAEKARTDSAIAEIVAAGDSAMSALKTYWNNWPSNDATDTANGQAMATAMGAYQRAVGANSDVAGVNAVIKQEAVQFADFMAKYAPTRAYLGGAGAAYVNNTAASYAEQAAALPSFAIGTNFIPKDMLAQVHEGERIIPKADNLQLMQRLQDPQANNEALVAEIRALREEVAQLRRDNTAENVATINASQKTAKILDRWDGEGTPEVREV